MKNINITPFKDLFSFVKELQQIGLTEKQKNEIKHKKLEEIKKPYEELTNEIKTSFERIGSQIEDLILNYSCENIDEKMNLKAKEIVFDKNYETIIRNEKIVESENEIMNSLKTALTLFSDVFSECNKQKEILGNHNNEMIKKLNKEDRRNEKEYEKFIVKTKKWEEEEIQRKQEDEKENKEKERQRIEYERGIEERRRKSLKKASTPRISGQSEIKVVCIGDLSSEKTQILVTYTTGCFPDTYKATVFDNHSCPISVNGQTIPMNLWDTSSGDDLYEMRPLSYPETDCFMVFFSIDDRESFRRVKEKWIPEIVANCGEDDPIIVLVGTHSEIRDDQRKIDELKRNGIELVEKEEIDKMKDEVGAVGVCEASAITQNGLKELFELVAKASCGFLDPPVGESKKEKKGLFKKIFG